MKYLRGFFESKSFDDDIVKDLHDICLELNDIEIDFTISDRSYYLDSPSASDSLCVKVPSIFISLQDFQLRFFTLDEIEPVIQRIRDYLNEIDNTPTGRFYIDLSIPNEDCYLSVDSFYREFSGEEIYKLNIIIYRRIQKTTEEVYYDSRKEVEGYVDANEIVGQRLWFHTNRTHRNNGWNGMIGIYNCTRSGRRVGLAGRYTNEVRLTSPIYFQSSEAGAKSIKASGDRTLIAGVSGVVIPTTDDTYGMMRVTYNPYDVGHFHLIDDEKKSKIISAEEVYFNSTEDGKWEFWVKSPIFE